MYMSIVIFAFVMFILLLIAFGLSYLFWSDRYKTPEVIAAEVGYVTERISSVSVSGLVIVGMILLVMVVSHFFPLSVH